MTQITTDSAESAVPPTAWLHALRTLAIAVALFAAAVLVASLLLLPVAQAQTPAKGEFRIGFQKGASLLVLQKAQGSLEKGSNVHYLLVRVLEKNGLKLSDIQPVYLPPADARAAFESRNVDAWVIWDPFTAAAEKQIGARVLADGTGIVNNYQYYLGERGFVEKNPQVIRAVFEDSVDKGRWVKANLRQAAELIAPLQGLAVDVTELSLRRYEFNVQPLSDAVIVDQQKIADTFFDLKLIPKAIAVRDASWKAAQ